MDILMRNTYPASIMSKDRLYRYSLFRSWLGGENTITWVCLNPSTADSTQSDPTLRRIMGFSRRWGFNSLFLVNLFALRSTDPKNLYNYEPVGCETDFYIKEASDKSKIVIAAWGTHPLAIERSKQIIPLLNDKLYYVKLSKDGIPMHPLYLPSYLTPIKWIHPND